MRNLATSWLAVCAALVLAAPAAAQNAELKSATDTLRLSLDEWQREDTAYRAARSASKLSQSEASEYAGFVAGLRVRALEQCETVRRLGGEEALRGYECVRISPLGGNTLVMVPPSAVLTEEEKKAAVEARLTEIEGEVDGSLQQRQQEIRQKAAAGSARSTSSGGGAGAGSGGAGAGSGGGGAGVGGASSASPGSTWGPPAGSSASTGSTTGQPSASSSPGNRGGPASRNPTDGGSDDDVVARQLREAAEKESDPVLKEKLWAEYRKYKESRK